MALIIGSGVNAGIIAMKLVKAGIPTTILEKGPYFEPRELYEKFTQDKIYDITTDETLLIPVSGEINNGDGIKSFETEGANDSEGLKKFIEIAKKHELTEKNLEKSIDGFGKEYVKAGFDYALTILNNVENIEIVTENENIVGVKYVKDDHDRMKYAKTVILTTDGLDTPILLKDTDVNCESIKYNPCATVSGRIRFELDDKLPFATIVKNNKVTLYPYILNAEDKILNILVKSNDTSEGLPDSEGNMLVKSDEGLDSGIELAKSIFEEMKAKDITVSEPRAMNPKGSASIGSVVDDNLETSIKGLFICDSSLSSDNIAILPLAEKLADYLENIDYDNNQYGKSDYGLGKPYGKMDGWWRESPKE